MPHFLGPQAAATDNDWPTKAATKGNGGFPTHLATSLLVLVESFQKSKSDNTQPSAKSSTEMIDLHKIKFEYPQSIHCSVVVNVYENNGIC